MHLPTQLRENAQPLGSHQPFHLGGSVSGPFASRLEGEVVTGEFKNENRMLQTIGQLATETPGAIPVFERYGVDYCCGGSRTLEAACEDRGLPVETLRAELAAAAALSPVRFRDWTEAPLSELTAHIVRKYHAPFRADLPLILALLDKTERSNSGHAAALNALRRALRRFRQDFEVHMRTEEQILFTAIQRLEAAVAAGGTAPRATFGSFRNPVRMLEGEHEAQARDLLQIREIAGGYAVPPDADDNYRALVSQLQALERDVHEHLHLENNVLFPRAMRAEEAAGTSHGK
jgi:regulator of cell morphogenesis and NO signaling